MSAMPSNEVHLPLEVAQAFRQAVRAAEAFRGATAPNPPVGCVVLDGGGRTLAVAAHERAGHMHAEAAALAICREQGTVGRIDTVVVTLEPCNHWGRTPPCSEAIMGTPARTVWFGASDPSLRAEGGAHRLRAAGRQAIELGGLSDPMALELAGRCRSLIGPFTKRVLRARPWVTVKQAVDPEGSMVPPLGQKTFTSPGSLTFAHALRKRADAILTGSGTVLADGPEFTVRRVVDHPGKRRLIAIMDRRKRTPRAYIESAEQRGFEVLIEQDLGAALERLGQRGVLEVLVEAGPSVTESVLRAGLWDEHIVIRKGRGDAPDTCEVRSRSGSGEKIDVVALDLYEPGA